jgi:hypothetical protein
MLCRVSQPGAEGVSHVSAFEHHVSQTNGKALLHASNNPFKLFLSYTYKESNFGRPNAWMNGRSIELAVK